MKNAPYIFAMILIVIWTTAYFGYNAGVLIHFLIIIAIGAVMYGVIKGNKS